MGNKVKNFVLDTNLLIHCPDSMFRFEDNNVFITHTTLEELDNHKSDRGEVGFNVRESIRLLQKLRKKGNLMEGVDLPNGGKLFLLTSDVLNYRELPDGWDKEKPDNIILLMTLKLKHEKDNVILVTNDMSMTTKADILKIPVQEYRNDRVSNQQELYTGRAEIKVSEDVMDVYEKDGEISCDMFSADMKLEENQFVVLMCGDYRLAGVCQNGKIRQLKFQSQKPFGVKPRNIGQLFAQEALMTSAEEVPLVILKGPAGTSKTFYSLACGLEQVIERNQYKRVLICRPNVKFDEDIGYLKGTEMDKIMPLIRPCLDNLEELITLSEKGQSAEEINDIIQEFFDRKWISAEALAYLRGRCITDTFIIIDEAQNTTANQILGIITRAGHGTKICVIGDVEQIDSPRLDMYNCGLSVASEKMRNAECVMQLTFTEDECTRSELSRFAAERLANR